MKKVLYLESYLSRYRTPDQKVPRWDTSIPTIDFFRRILTLLLTPANKRQYGILPQTCGPLLPASLGMSSLHRAEEISFYLLFLWPQISNAGTAAAFSRKGGSLSLARRRVRLRLPGLSVPGWFKNLRGTPTQLALASWQGFCVGSASEI